MINVEIIKVHAGQILPCGRVTGNKEFTIGGLEDGMLIVKIIHTHPLMIGTYTDQILKYIHLKMQILTVLSQVCYTLQKLKHDNRTKFPLESYQIQFW